MRDTRDGEEEARAQAQEQEQEGAEHFLRAVSALGDTQVVQAQGAIYAANGTKLVDKGARVDSRVYAQLIAHKLREPIEEQLTVEGAVDVAGVLALAETLLREAPLARLIADAEPGAALLAPLRRLVLPPAIALRLTVMREQQASLFAHSVEMALVAVFLGRRNRMSDADCAALATAALLHDVGMLHMDPAWRDPAYRLSGRERKHLVAHPITSMLLVRGTRAYTPAVEQAILEHHERHDGSGYPRGVRAEDISPLGKVLLLAEVAAAMFEKYTRAPALRLSLVLRMKHRLFEPSLVAQLMPLLRGQIARDAAAYPAGAQQGLDEVLGGAIALWHRQKAVVTPAQWSDSGRTPWHTLEARLAALERALTEAGSDPDSLAALREMLQGDVEGLAELDLMAYETLWELRSIADECMSRWPALAEGGAGAGDAAMLAVAQWCAWIESHVALAPDSAAAPLEPATV
jgi:HD-GYP domain-containing protein (c-di-GMP phosphodiesterase class II)